MLREKIDITAYAKAEEAKDQSPYLLTYTKSYIMRRSVPEMRVQEKNIMTKKRRTE